MIHYHEKILKIDGRISFSHFICLNVASDRHNTRARTICKGFELFEPINTVIKPGEGMFNGKKEFVRCY